MNAPGLKQQLCTTVIVVTPDEGIFVLYNSHLVKLGIIVP